MNPNREIFVAHSNKFLPLTLWFAEYLKFRGLNPIVLELTPNHGKTWPVSEKWEYYLNLCDSAFIIATPDEIQDGKPVSRMNVVFEMGAVFKKKYCVWVKEESTQLPTVVKPTYYYSLLKILKTVSMMLIEN